MPPVMSSFAKLISMLCSLVETQVPFVVARTVTFSGSPSRLMLAMSFHAICGSVTPQPTGGFWCIESRTGKIESHIVSTRTSVTEFSKSTS